MGAFLLGTGGPSGMPRIVAGVVGLTIAGIAFVGAGRWRDAAVRRTGRTLCIVFALMMAWLVFSGWVTEMLSNDPPL